MQMNTIIWVYVAVHLADESAVGAINRPLQMATCHHDAQLFFGGIW